MQILCLCGSQHELRIKVVLFTDHNTRPDSGWSSPPFLGVTPTSLITGFCQTWTGLWFQVSEHIWKPEPPLTISPDEPGGGLSLFINSPVFLSYMLCSNNLVLLSKCLLARTVLEFWKSMQTKRYLIHVSSKSCSKVHLRLIFFP